MEYDTIKCNTCKAAFSGIDRIKEHFKGEWHIFNSKRRANELAPIKKTDFKLLVSQNVIKLKNHSSSSTAPSVKSESILLQSIMNPSLVSDHQSFESKPESLQPDQSGSINTTVIDGTQFIENEAESNSEIWEDVEDEILTSSKASLTMQPKLGISICLFDDKDCGSTEECLQYMAMNFGFFIPDNEYLTDLDGLLLYIGEKIKLGGYCLYCQKRFAPGRPCQNHMISKSHCKIAYKEGIDLEEFEDFYDFTSSYDDLIDEEFDEEGNLIGNEMQITSIGELILPNGKKVGHRDFRIYYKQRFSPQECRPSVLAQQKEELLRLGYKFGDSQLTAEKVEELSDVDVMSMMVKYHKAIRKGEIIEQQSKLRQLRIDQRREIKSKVENQHAGINRTAKIRDYHKTVM